MKLIWTYTMLLPKTHFTNKTHPTTLGSDKVYVAQILIRSSPIKEFAINPHLVSADQDID
jgi:hypothetical protein